MNRCAYGWAVVALLWAVALLNYVDRQVIFSVLPLVRADLHLSDIQIGLLGTAFLWVRHPGSRVQLLRTAQCRRPR